MTPDEIWEFNKKVAQDQIDLNKKVLDNHLAAADRIHARLASEAIVKSTVDLMDYLRQNPPQPVT